MNLKKPKYTGMLQKKAAGYFKHMDNKWDMTKIKFQM